MIITSFYFYFYCWIFTKYEIVITSLDMKKWVKLLFLLISTDRYRNLRDVCHQEEFLDVQLFLLDSFISRLTLEAEETSFAPAGLHYCSVLNAANYIELILQEWSEQVVCTFLNLGEMALLHSSVNKIIWIFCSTS